MKYAALVLVLALASPASAATTITVSAGPEGGYAVHISGDTYDVIPMGGGAFWIGTDREYERGHALAVARDEGMRPVNVAGIGEAFVKTYAYATRAGAIAIAGVEPYPILGVTSTSPVRRPVIQSTERYAGLVWVQSVDPAVSVAYYDRKTHRTFRPYKVDPSPGYHIAEFILPRSAFRDPMLAIFASRTAVGVVGFSSIAKADYAIIQHDIASDRNDGIEPSDDQRSDLHALPLLDPSIAVTR